MSSTSSRLSTLQRSHSFPGAPDSRATPELRLPPRQDRTALLPNTDVAVQGRLIDANRIHQRIGGKTLRYIASAHPKKLGPEVYAHLLWQDEVRCAVSLHPCEMLPAVNGTRVLGDYVLRTLSETSIGNGVAQLRHGEITCGGETRPFTTLECNKWPDGKTLKPAALAQLLAAVRPFEPEPILVHCNAGLGRTGTFVASCLAQQLREAHPHATATSLAYQAIWMARMHRGGMVESLDQQNSIIAIAANGLETPEDKPLAPLAEDDAFDMAVQGMVAGTAAAHAVRDGRYGAWIAPQPPQGKAQLGHRANRLARWALAPVDFLLFGGGASLLRHEVPVLSQVYREGALRSVLLGCAWLASGIGCVIGLAVGQLIDAIPGDASDELTEQGMAESCGAVAARLFALPFKATALLGTYLTAPLKAAAFLAGQAAQSATTATQPAETELPPAV